MSAFNNNVYVIVTLTFKFAFVSVDSGYRSQVVFHPSYSAPEEGEFSLHVTGAGSTGGTAGTPALQQQQSAVAPLKLKCIARVRQKT